MIVTGLFVYWSILAKYSLYLMREKLYQFFHKELIITVVSTQVFDELIQVVLSGSVTLSFKHTVTFKVNVICLTFWHYMSTTLGFYCILFENTLSHLSGSLRPLKSPSTCWTSLILCSISCKSGGCWRT